MYLLKYIFFISFLIFSKIIYAQSDTIFVINQLKNEFSDLNNHLFCFEDEDGFIGYPEILSKNNSFMPYYKFKQPLKNNSTYWGKISIYNNSSNLIDAILIFGGKRNSDYADIYVVSQNGKTDTLKSGYFCQASLKSINKEVGSKIKLELKPDEIKTIYVKIKNISNFSPAFNLKLQNLSFFYDTLAERNFYQGLLHGLLFIMFLYNLLIFLISRDKPYLYYALYIFTIAINFLFEKGLLNELVFKEYPLFDIYIFIFTSCFIGIFYFLFARHFINTMASYSKWDIIFKYIILFKVVQFFIMILITVLTFNIKIVLNIGNIGNFVELIFGTLFIIDLSKRKNKIARFFIFGTIFLIVSTIVTLLFLIFVKNPTFDVKIFMYIGVILELLSFSLGLGERIQIMEKEKRKAQDLLINQLKENELLQTKVNRELENKVKERTAEIEQQKEEISSIAENLSKANELLINQNEEITKQKEILTLQNKKITDSIIYAKRIQTAVLPVDKNFEEIFAEHFIVFKPKDIVSGDFYFLKKIGNKIFIAVADCTGHGVPGAFMSMLGNALLNEIVRRPEICNANQALNELRKQLKNSLHQQGKNDIQKDGMDMSLCILNTELMTLEYSGANNPVYIIKSNDASEHNSVFIELKPDKMPVGIYPKEEKSFFNHTVQICNKDILYLFSDGYEDQFGGNKGRKFLIQNLRKLLFKIHNEPLTFQKEILEKTFDEWKGSNIQIDDITIVGLKI